MTAPPLAGARLAVGGPPAVVAVAEAALRELGAELGAPRPAGRAELAGTLDPSLDAGLPRGTIAHAAGLAVAGGAVVSLLAGEAVAVGADAVAALVLLPEVVEPLPPARPSPPRPAPGGGWLSAELGAPGDEEAFGRLLGTLGPGAGALAVEAAAQEWRLPVVAYRPRAVPGQAPSAPGASEPGAVAAGDTPRPLGGVAVLDLTAMWAGPLATWLLAALGAAVTKVEAPVRPDGMRGQRATFAALDRGKDHASLDLRQPEAHAELVARARDADVLIDSFSPRVMPNLGLTRDRLVGRNHRLVAASITAFPAGTPEHGWVAYGTGAHAFCGLGHTGTGFAAPAVSYPDPLAGLAAFAAVAAALAGRRPCRGGGSVAVSLVGAAAPLACGGADPATLAEPPGPGAAALTARLGAHGWLDAAGFPRPPFSCGGPR